MAWRQLVTDWTSWCRLCVAPSSYLLVVALVATLYAKSVGALDLRGEPAWKIVPVVGLLDVAVFMGAAGLFAWLEARSRFASWLTIPLAATLAVFGCINAAYLVLAGEQGSWSALEGLVKQAADIEMVLSSMVDARVAGYLVLGVAVAVALPFGVRRILRRHAGPWDARGHAQIRARCAWLIAAPAVLATYTLPGPNSVDARSLTKNAIWTIARTTTNTFEKGRFSGYPNKRLVSADTIEAFAGREPVNVLFFFLESTRYDHTSLVATGEGLAETPHLAALAGRGVVAHDARAVLPHTTKSMFTMLCGRLPTMQRGIVEVSDDPRFQCLPRILRDAGYRTMFVQSAFGTFEQRARLVRKFGYEDFEAWEDMRGQVLGYLASEDVSMVDALGSWLDHTDAQKPFFATLLSSATHHPYRLSRELRSRLVKSDRSDKPRKTSAQRYARLVEEEDRVLGLVIEELRRRDLLDNTLILAVGDHGEGFGEHGVRQHDNNYFEEGLRVPFVLAGPGIEPGVVPGNVSLIDVVPTLLARWGMDLEPLWRDKLLGRDILDPKFDTSGQPRFFSCYSPMRCRGFVMDRKKLVYVPETDEMWAFDLATDPGENNPLVPDDALMERVPRLHQLVEDHRIKGWKMKYARVAYGDWLCRKSRNRCKHPGAHKAGHRVVGKAARAWKARRAAAAKEKRRASRPESLPPVGPPQAPVPGPGRPAGTTSRGGATGGGATGGGATSASRIDGSIGGSSPSGPVRQAAPEPSENPQRRGEIRGGQVRPP